MTAPRLVSCYFPGDAPEMFDRLARVLEFTARQKCAQWSIEVTRIAPEPCHARCGTAAYEHNTQKLDEWTRIVNTAEDGQCLLLLDTDTMIVRPLDDIWDGIFDVAYTVRPSHCKLPLNAGVVFARVSDRARDFFRCWRDENRRMFNDRQYHNIWRRRYGGINQAALGATLESPAARRVFLMNVPCAEWNCEDSTWSAFQPDVTRIVHVKGELRRALFYGPRRPALKPLIAMWQRAEAAAGQAVPA